MFAIVTATGTAFCGGDRLLWEGTEHYHKERHQQGEGNVPLMPSEQSGYRRGSPIQCRERLGGLLKYYHREVA